MAFFSIIIPTYNSAKTIHRCIDSIMKQSFRDFEVIISDNRSSDGTLDIVTAFRDDRISVVSKDDKGIYDAMNSGINRSKGLWLLFLGSDDLMYGADVLQLMVEYIENSDANIIYGDVKVMGDTPWAKDGEFYPGKSVNETLFDYNICHQSIFYSRKVFENGIRYNVDYSVCADYDLNLRLASDYKIEYTGLPISLFNSDGLSSNGSDSKFENDKWPNIVQYYQGKLKGKEFYKYKNRVKETSRIFLKRSQPGLAFLALSTYFVQKFNKLFGL